MFLNVLNLNDLQLLEHFQASSYIWIYFSNNVLLSGKHLYYTSIYTNYNNNMSDIKTNIIFLKENLLLIFSHTTFISCINELAWFIIAFVKTYLAINLEYSIKLYIIMLNLTKNWVNLINCISRLIKPLRKNI